MKKKIIKIIVIFFIYLSIIATLGCKVFADGLELIQENTDLINAPVTNRMEKIGLYIQIISYTLTVLFIIISIVKKRKNNKKWWIFIICGIILFLLGYYCYIIENYTARKPIIYLYPEEKMNVHVELGKKKNITCSYPKYKDYWFVEANPDGTLTEIETGKKLYALYWEGKNYSSKIEKDGFVVPKDDVTKFLEEKLEILGLNYKEKEEFIVYWLPKLEKNDYNFIRFASNEKIEENMPLKVTPKPDTIIRIMMEFKKVSKNYKCDKQILKRVERNGFTVVEWGGTEIK